MASTDFCYNCFAELNDAKCSVCGYEHTEDNEDNLALPPGTILNKQYKIGRVLGMGGFGITYKALDIKKNIIVAIKEYVPMNLVYRDNYKLEVKMAKQQQAYDKGLLSFIEEANFLVLLKTNIHIVAIFNCFNENNTAYFSMEYIDGSTLDKATNMNFNNILNYMIETANTLKVIHNKNIIHRDISPQNIFITKDKKIKLIDFGNARYINKSYDDDDMLVLKPSFAPPELYMKQNNIQGPWTDIYSLAATFYRLATKTKLPNALERINGTPIIPIRRFYPAIDYGLEVAINRALELDYDKRYRTINEFLSEIRNPTYQNDDSTEYFELNNNNTSYKKQSNTFNNSTSTPPAPVATNQAVSYQAKGYVISYDSSRYIVSDIRHIVIGRDFHNSHIVINDGMISRKHCVIEYNTAKQEFYVTDWSSNGTFLADGTKIGYGTKFTLKPNSELHFNNSKYILKVVIE